MTRNEAEHSASNEARFHPLVIPKTLIWSSTFPLTLITKQARELTCLHLVGNMSQTHKTFWPQAFWKWFCFGYEIEMRCFKNDFWDIFWYCVSREISLRTRKNEIVFEKISGVSFRKWKWKWKNNFNIIFKFLNKKIKPIFLFFFLFSNFAESFPKHLYRKPRDSFSKGFGNNTTRGFPSSSVSFFLRKQPELIEKHIWQNSAT